VSKLPPLKELSTSNRILEPKPGLFLPSIQRQEIQIFEELAPVDEVLTQRDDQESQKIQSAQNSDQKVKSAAKVVTTDQLPVIMIADSPIKTTPEPIKFSRTLNPFVAKHKTEILKMSPNFQKLQDLKLEREKERALLRIQFLTKQVEP